METRQPLIRRLNPLRMLAAAVDAQLDSPTGDANDARRRIVLDVALIAGIATSTTIGIIYIWISTLLAVFHLIAACVFLLILLAHRSSRATVFYGRIGGTFLFAFLVVTSWNLGGLNNASMAWFVVVPLAAAIIVGTADAWFWIGMTSLTAIAFFIASLRGIQPTNVIDLDFRAFSYLFMFIALMLVVGVLITTWLAGQRLLEAQLNRALSETEGEAVNARVLASTSTAANESAAFDATAEDCMNILCDALGWEAAHLWIRNDDGTIVPTMIVSSNIDPVFAPLIPGADETIGTKTKFFPQIVAESRSEIVRSDMAGDRRADAARAAGLKSVLVWPVVIDGIVDAVLEFFSRRPIILGERSRQLLHHVSLQLAHVRGREVARGRIEQLAYYDIVTGLPNRHAFERRFGAILDAAARRQTRVALMFIDLDGFKYVNDSLGHAAGDRLLHTIGEKLSENLRGSDFTLKLNPSSSPMVARLGGDEFTVVLQDLRELHGADVVARRFLEIISKPVNIGGQEVVIGASIGISIYPDDAGTRSDLLRLADAAMYEAKRAAGNRYRFATEALNASVQRRVWLENELRRALANGRIAAHYQPVVDAASNAVVGYEALARWRHDGHWIEPAEFIPLAEETGLVHELGECILQKACTEIAALNSAGAGPFRMSVNVSPHQLRQEHFVAKLSAVLADTACDPGWIVLELTESSLIIDDSASIELLNKIRAIGVGIALDDFGTGYASLSYLRTFPLDYVKIDRSFISGEGRIDEDDAIIAAITAMSHILNLEVVAEGIETAAQAERARALGCDAIQGYFFGRPAVLTASEPAADGKVG